MTIGELIEVLMQYDPKLEVRFLGYACGDSFLQTAESHDFRRTEKDQHGEPCKPYLQINSEWN